MKILKHISLKPLYRSVSCLLFLVVFQITILFLTAQTGYPAQVIIDWDPNSEATLSGYNIYYGTQSRSYTFSRDVGNQTSYIITGLAAGTTYFFAATAYDKDGNESDYCEEAIYTTPNSDTTTTAITATTTIPGTATTTLPVITTTTAIITSTTSTAAENPADNQPPVANAGEDRTMLLGTTISLDGRGSYDPDSDKLQYHWEVRSGPAEYLLQNDSTATPAFKALSTGTYIISLKVFDGITYQVEDLVAITVQDKSSGSNNTAPVAIAGEDQTAYAGEVITLDGSGSYDNDNENDVLSYSWSQLSGPVVELENSNSAAPSFTAETAGSYEFELIVSDGILESQPDTATIIIEDIIAPPDNEIQLIAPENKMPVIDSLMFKWQAQEFDIFKVQISYNGKRFNTIGFTKQEYFNIQEPLLKLLATDTVTQLYWRVIGKKTGTEPPVQSEIRTVYLVNNNYDGKGKFLKEILQEIFSLFKIILGLPHQ